MVNRLASFAPLLVGAVTALIGAGPAMASTVSLTLNDGLTPGYAGGTATLSIQDIATGEVQVTLTPNLLAPSQTLTGLWLNAPGFTGLTVTPVTPNPNPYVSSAYTSTQTTVPGGATAAGVGQYDLYVKFSNGSSPVIQGTSPSEVFDITATGGPGPLTATSFDVPDAPKGTGSPSNFYALIGLTNYLGTGGSGVGFISATSATIVPVPLPASAWLLLSGLGGIGWLRNRRRA